MISLFRRHTWAGYEHFWTGKLKKSALSSDLIQSFSMNKLSPMRNPCSSPCWFFGYCHDWLCGACASAWSIWLDMLCVKIIQQNRRIKEIACLNQQVLGDRCYSQIKETKLKEQSVLGNQFIRFSNTILMLDTLYLWPTNPPWEFMFLLYWGAEPHSIHGQLQQHRIMMECQFFGWMID